MGYGSESGPGGRICTRTGSVLSGVPLLLGYAGEKMVLPVGIAPTTRRFEAGRSDLLSYGSFVEMVRRGGSAPPASAMSVRRSAIDLPARECRALCAAMSGGPGWIRTINLPIQSRALR